MKKSLLLLFAAFATLVASAQTKVEIDGIWYYLIKKVKQAEVTYKGDSYDSYNDEYSGSITIPATVTHNGVAYSVTSIGEEAFRGCSSLTAINIPEGVKSIRNWAFSDCSSLTAIVVAEGNKVYDSRNGCNAIIETKSNTLIQGCSATIIPEGVTSIGDGAFYECSSLTTITIPEGVTSIKSGAFDGCSSLERVTINCANVGSWFSGLSSLKEIVLGEGVTSIGSYAFSGCSSLTTIVVAKGNKVYDSRNGCNAIIETNSNTLIQGCSATIIPEGVTSIGDGAFYECSSLTTITIPEGVTSIGNHVFSWCRSLAAITIPESVTSIGGGAFSNCRSLAAITIPEGVTSIKSGAFSWCSSLTAITIPEGVTSIGNNAFSGCTSLTAINIPEGVTSIEDQTFYDCSSLTAITIPEGVTSIGDDAFLGCSSLTAITIPEGVTSIGREAFDGCRSLTAITIPEGVTSIGNGAFAGCSSITTINVAEGNANYDSRGGCNAIIETGSNTLIAGCAATIIPEGVKSIGGRAFLECSSLTAITIPEGVTSIGEYAFANCYKLRDVYCYAESVPSTEANAFNGYSLEYATLHVPASAINSYKATAPWSSFGTIVCLTDEDMSIEQLTNDNSQQTIYDLCGRRVEKAEKGGIYIVAGKKVIIK